MNADHQRTQPRRASHRLPWLAALGLVWATCLTSPGTACGAEINYEMALRSPHVWRGITLRNFSVLNLSVTARFDNGVAAQLWLGIDLGDGNGRQGDVQEIDLDLSRTWATDRAAITLGFVELIFPGGIDSTGELYAKWISKGPASPRLEVFYNVDLLHDFFAQFSLSHRSRTTGNWIPSGTATIAYAGIEYAKFFGGSQAGLHHWGLTIDLDYNRRQQGVKFRLGYSQSLNKNVLPEQPTRFWSGVYWSFRQP